MSQEASLEVAMQLIMYGGEAKSCAIEAMAAAKKRDFQGATERMAAARAALLEAHHAQAGVLAQEAQGIEQPFSLFMIHGQDHLMTSIAFVDLAQELIEVYQVLAQ